MPKPISIYEEIALYTAEPLKDVRDMLRRNNLSGVQVWDACTVHKVRCMADLSCALCVHKNTCAKVPDLRRLLRKIGTVNDAALKKVEGFQEDEFYDAIQNLVQAKAEAARSVRAGG